MSEEKYKAAVVKLCLVGPQYIEHGPDIRAALNDAVDESEPRSAKWINGFLSKYYEVKVSSRSVRIRQKLGVGLTGIALKTSYPSQGVVSPSHVEPQKQAPTPQGGTPANHWTTQMKYKSFVNVIGRDKINAPPDLFQFLLDHITVGQISDIMTRSKPQPAPAPPIPVQLAPTVPQPTDEEEDEEDEEEEEEVQHVKFKPAVEAHDVECRSISPPRAPQLIKTKLIPEPQLVQLIIKTPQDIAREQHLAFEHAKYTKQQT